MVISMLLPQVEACVKVIDALRVCIGPGFLVPNTPAADFENICDLYKAYVTHVMNRLALQNTYPSFFTSSYVSDGSGFFYECLQSLQWLSQ